MTRCGASARAGVRAGPNRTGRTVALIPRRSPLNVNDLKLRDKLRVRTKRVDPTIQTKLKEAYAYPINDWGKPEPAKVIQV